MNSTETFKKEQSFSNIGDIKMKILCIGAHPDDLEIGMGGTIAKFIEAGHEVLMLVAIIPEYQDIPEREKETMNGSKILGADVKFMRIPVEEMVFNRTLVKKIDQEIKNFGPDMAFIHWIHDSHQDHQALSHSCIAAFRKNKCSLYMYEQTIPGGITPYAFKPQMFINIDNQIDKKIDSLKEHASQMKNLNQENTWIYGVRGRAQYRGYQMGCKFAEAFEVIKEIKNI